MTYVITHGPLGAETETACETAGEALSLLTRLMVRGVREIMVANFETGDEALDHLRLLAEEEKHKAADDTLGGT